MRNGKHTLYSSCRCSPTSEGFEHEVLDLYETIAFNKVDPIKPTKTDLKRKLSEAKQRYRDRALNQDGVRLPTHVEAELKGARDDDRELQNMRAIGGMRSPRRSVEKLPGRREVGRRIAAQITISFIK